MQQTFKMVNLVFFLFLIGFFLCENIIPFINIINMYFYYVFNISLVKPYKWFFLCLASSNLQQVNKESNTKTAHSEDNDMDDDDSDDDDDDDDDLMLI